MTLYAQADPPLIYWPQVGLERSGQQSVWRIAGKGENQMSDVLHRNAVLEQRVIDRVGKRHIAQLEQACRDEGKSVGGRQSAILVQDSPCFGENLGGEPGAALRFCLQEMQLLGVILKDTDDVVTAHRHVAMVFPA